MTSESLREQHESLGRAVTKLISEQAAKLDSAPVTSPATPAELRTLFDEPLPINGMPAEDILAQFARDVAPHAMQIPSPHYFGQFNPAPLAIGVWADALCSALNQNAGAWRNGPTSALIEDRAIRWLCELLGYGAGAFGVLASGGSSNGVIDSLPELAAIARENNCWFHVDAAYGGGLAFSDRHRDKLRGIELANSITFDPHKWMFVPFACGATLVRDGGRVLRDSFDISPEYLNEDRGGADVEYDFFRYGQMGTRRFNALKLWMAFKFMGKRGYAETVERHIELTEYFAGRLDELPDFERIGEIETAVCCFRYLPEWVRSLSQTDQDRAQQNLQQRIEKSGKAFFPSTILHGRRALRVNINSYLTEARHVNDLVELLVVEAQQIQKGEF